MLLTIWQSANQLRSINRLVSVHPADVAARLENKQVFERTWSLNRLLSEVAQDLALREWA